MKLTIDVPEKAVKEAIEGIPSTFFLAKDHPVRILALALKEAYEAELMRRAKLRAGSPISSLGGKR
jgi:hypothetical protein